MQKRLSNAQYEILVEALRRYTRFHQNRTSCGASCYGTTEDEHLMVAWIGLGSMTTYKPALDAGLMTYATDRNPGSDTWWKLTPKGAEIVRKWINAGIDYEHIESGMYPLNEPIEGYNKELKRYE